MIRAAGAHSLVGGSLAHTVVGSPLPCDTQEDTGSPSLARSQAAVLYLYQTKQHACQDTKGAFYQ